MNENPILGINPGAAESPVPHTNPPEHLLVVEDDACLCRLNVRALERAGYDVAAAADGAAAWRMLGNQTYDLMITDQSMPNLTGVELLKKLYAGRMSFPVVMATGTVPTAELHRYPWLQPSAMLLKPYTSEALVQTVQRTLREVDQPPASPSLFLYRDVDQKEATPVVATPQPIFAAGPHAERRILIVDEDHDLRLLYGEALTGAGYRLDFAVDGAAAWATLQARHYDLLITEHALPKLTGVELIRKLRAAHMALPVVLAASRCPEAELARHPYLQLAAVILKPFTIDLLLATVTEALRVPARPGLRRSALRPTSKQLALLTAP